MEKTNMPLLGLMDIHRENIYFIASEGSDLFLF
jgi:hypothetical protein